MRLAVSRCAIVARRARGRLLRKRRKVSRRIIRKRVLLELRSGIERRRNQRGSDTVEHIDEKA